MVRVSQLLFAIVIMIVTTTVGSAQRMMRMNAEDAVILRETGVIITSTDGKISVMMVPPAGSGQSGLQTIDAQAGDVVGMANGKRIKSIKELKEAYEATKPGEEFKLGLLRDGKAMIASFTRKSEADMPQGGQMRMVRREEGGNENEDMFPALGFGLRKEGEDVVVSETMPHAPKAIAKGDKITALNGSRVGNVADFNMALDKVKVGGDLKIEYTRDGKKMTHEMKRPEPQGQVRMMRRQN